MCCNARRKIQAEGDLADLRRVAVEVMTEMDALMVGPSTRERGMAIAELMCRLSDEAKATTRKGAG
jgi:hypothetical protein